MIREFQEQIEKIYGERDRARGAQGCFLWLVEEVGELARAITNDDPDRTAEAGEFADCLAWLATLASIRGIDLADAAWGKYRDGCPRCAALPCACDHRERKE